MLSQAQLDLLAEHGEERTADPGEVLFEVGDESYPFMAILEGEAAIRDQSGRELIRHGVSGFVGELNLLTGQTVFLRAVATKPMRYIAVDRIELRALLFEDPDLADLLLSAFVSRRELLQAEDGLGIEVIGPRSSERTRGIAEWLRSARIPYRWRDLDGTRRTPVTTRRRPWSSHWPQSGCRSCAYRGASSSRHRATARSPERSESASSLRTMRRWTC